jgi:hypothetical protein
LTPGTQKVQRRIDRFLKAASHFLSRFAHIPQSLPREILPKSLRFLQSRAHPRFSSWMIRSTRLRISSDE